MKLLLFADNIVGENTLSFLLNEYIEDLALVVTMENNKLKMMADEAGIPVEIFESSEALYNTLSLKNMSFDLGVLAWWPKIIKPSLITVSSNGFINFHPSLLPYNRGKHYNFWALVEGAPFGVSLHFIDEGVDTGDIVAQRELSYDWTDTGETLYYKAQKEIVSLFCERYPSLRLLQFTREQQDLSRGSFHRSSELDTASQINLDKHYSGREIINLLRARTFKGHPGCWFYEDGVKYETQITIKRITA